MLLTVKPYWKVYSNNHWDRKKLDQSTAVSLKLRIYNITIDGKVDLAQEIDTKWFESPSAGFMRGKIYSPIFGPYYTYLYIELGIIFDDFLLLLNFLIWSPLKTTIRYELFELEHANNVF